MAFDTAEKHHAVEHNWHARCSVQEGRLLEMQQGHGYAGVHIPYVVLVNPPDFRVACKELGDHRCNVIENQVHYIAPRSRRRSSRRRSIRKIRASIISLNTLNVGRIDAVLHDPQEIRRCRRVPAL